MDTSRFQCTHVLCICLIAIAGVSAAPVTTHADAALGDTYIERFNAGTATGWQPMSGSWSVTSGTYANAAVVETAITKAPLDELWATPTPTDEVSYTFKVRVLNPYGARGNLAGVAWVLDSSNYTEAVFSPTGEARLNKVSNGVRSTISSATYLGGDRNRWFEIEVAYTGAVTGGVNKIKVNGVPIFDDAPGLSAGQLSLITHWAPARFDDVRAAPHVFTPFVERFDDAVAPPFAAAGTWIIANGALNNDAVEQASRAYVSSVAGWHELADISFRARMINRFRSSGNLVGFTYGAQGTSYYEAVFGPTGVAHLRKVVDGHPTAIATARYQGGERNRWFDAELIQIGQRTTVKVNGVVVFNNVLQPDGSGGQLGFVAHWTNASIDNVSLSQIPVTRYRLTQLPGLSSPSVTQVRALNDRGEVVGGSRTEAGRLTAVLWRGGGVTELVSNVGDGAAANDINNKGEIVGGQFGRGAFYWRDGVLEPFLFPECDRGEALGINERSEIAGICGAEGDGTSAVLRKANGQLVTLEELPGGFNWSHAWAVNDLSEVVGRSSGSQGHKAVSWRGGTVETLDSSMFTDFHLSDAYDINNSGTSVGLVSVNDMRQEAVMWKNRELLVLPIRASQFHAQALGINEHEVVVGTTSAHMPDDRDRESRATLWQEGGIADLNELIACSSLPASNWLVSAMDINERGEIAVNAFDLSISESKAFLLTPISGQERCWP